MVHQQCLQHKFNWNESLQIFQQFKFGDPNTSCAAAIPSYEAHFRKFTTLGKTSDPIREFYYFFTYFFKPHKVTRVATQSLPNEPKVFQLLHLNWKYNAISDLINLQQFLVRRPPVTFGSNQKSTLIDIRWVKPLARKWPKVDLWAAK